MIKFINLKDSKGSPVYGEPLLDSIFHANIPPDTIVSIPIAPDPDACMISSTGHFIVSPFPDISLPVNPIFEQTSGMLNLSTIQLSNLYSQTPFIAPTNLYFIAPAQCLIYISFFSIT